MNHQPQRSAPQVFARRVMPVPELSFGAAAHSDRREQERRDRSPEGGGARRFEHLMAAVLQIHEADGLRDALNEAVHAACDCVGAEWAVLHWSPPGELTQVVRWGVDRTSMHKVTLPLPAPRWALAAGPCGVLHVGRAWPGEFDRCDRLLLAYVANATVVAAMNATRAARSEAANAGKDQILAMVSHDLRGPVAVVLAGATELLDGSPEQSTVRAVAEGISRATGTMSRLLADLLDGAQVAAGTFSITRAPTDLSAVLTEVAQTSAPAARARGISLRITEGPPGQKVLCDRARLMQVFGNLLGNALKFTPRSGRVDVEATVASGRAVFRICDTGPGVSADQRSHVFTRFWKGAGRHSGAGLGLYIAKTIVNAHGGALELEAAGPSGAVFRFDLPLAT